MNSVLILIFAISSAISQTCWSPLLEWGVCTPLTNCDHLNQALLTWSRDEKKRYDMDYFRSFLCSVNPEATGVHVCCSRSMPEVLPPKLPSPPYVPSDIARDPVPAPSEESDSVRRIYGGTAAELDEFPWMALLFYRAPKAVIVEHHCGGSLLNNRYVLTAGHCYGRSASLEFVRLGEYDTKTDKDCVHRDGRTFCAETHQDIAVEKFVAHPQYDRSATPSLHDIALIKLNRSPQYNDYVRPILLPSPQTKLVVGESVSLAGWGKSFPDSQAMYKQKVTLPIYDHAKCAEFYLSRKPNPFKITEAQVCAGGEFGKDGCNGDSGGPLMRVTSTGQWEVVAVTSFAQHCGNQSPGVYTGVEPYLNWIHRTMRQ